MADTDCAYDGPAEVDAVRRVITMINSSEGQFDLDVWRLDDGHNYAELVAHVDEENRRWQADEPGLGHPPFADLVGEQTVLEGETGALVMDVVAGVYGLVCIPTDPTLIALYNGGTFTATE